LINLSQTFLLILKKENKNPRIVHQSICVIQDGSNILLGLKKIGLGVGYWNSAGGHIEEGELAHEAAIREAYEELGVTVHEIEKMGLLTIEGEIDKTLHLHIFKSIRHSGNPIESNELKPRWFKVDELPFDNMWPNDRHWLPIFLRGDKFEGACVYDNGVLLSQEICIVDNVG
jgi:8-oxo-dGTP pyrophosphatase MutT (NUDIX family)